MRDEAVYEGERIREQLGAELEAVHAFLMYFLLLVHTYRCKRGH